MTANKYDAIILRIFQNHFRQGLTEFYFDRNEFSEVARALGIEIPKNLGDVIYSYRFRKSLPEDIELTEVQGKKWQIELAGRGRYKFRLAEYVKIAPSPLLEEIRIPDSTPGLIALYAYSDEQALLAILRYNRLLDVFTGKTCYSLQNHLRTTVPSLGQVETDEIYLGLDQDGNHYVFPVQAKGNSDKIGLVQVEQDIAVCDVKFHTLICIPIAAQFIERDLIALFSFKLTSQGLKLLTEKHYRLIPSEDYSTEG